MNQYELLDYIKDSYKKVRNNPHIIDELYLELDTVSSKIINTKQTDPNIYSRYLSIVSLKNDMMIQKYLDKEQIDLYFYELKNLVETKYYLDSYEESFFKILECTGKIQHAYNLIGRPEFIGDFYSSLVDLFFKEGVFKRYNDFIIENNMQLMCGTSIEMSVAFLMKVFFDKNLDYLNLEENMFVNMIISYWKIYKMKHYNISEREIQEEGYKNYDFIYRS